MAAAAAWLALLAPGFTAGREAPDASPGELLESVMKHYRDGELESAWEAYQAFFAHPGNGDVDVHAFGNCFYKAECPSVGRLAHVLGRDRSEADDLRSFCPTWETVWEDADPDEYTEEQLSEARETMEGFVWAAFGGRTCPEWADLNANRFHARAGKWPRTAQSVPLAAPKADDPRPVADIVVAPDQRLTALVDTGVTTTSLDSRRIDGPAAGVEAIGEVPVVHVRHHSLMPAAKVAWPRLGTALFQRPVVSLRDGGDPLERGFEGASYDGVVTLDGIIGMNLLLQYDSVCFDWERRTLHLGELGPCGSGLAPYRAWLDKALSLLVEAVNPSGAVADARIDTGFVGTGCSHGFVGPDAASGEAVTEMFSFGEDAKLQGECTYYPTILFDLWNSGDQVEGNHMYLGMGVLGKFAAFGWRLNPLKVYFVPKPDGLNPAGSRSSALQADEG